MDLLKTERLWQEPPSADLNEALAHDPNNRDTLCTIGLFALTDFDEKKAVKYYTMANNKQSTQSSKVLAYFAHVQNGEKEKGEES